MARRSKAPSAPPSRLILDAGAVVALSRGDHRARVFLARAMEAGAEVLVPSVVVAETTRGNPRDAAVNRIISAIDRVPPADEATARIAGALLGLAHSSDTIDSLVVATSVAAGGGRILTGDPADLKRLAASLAGVEIHRI